MLILETAALHLLAKSVLASTLLLHICDKIAISHSLLSKKMFITLSSCGIFFMTSLNNTCSISSKGHSYSLSKLLLRFIIFSAFNIAGIEII